ncbi:MAG: DUF4249 family protein [Bacteroidales bacterium]
MKRLYIILLGFICLVSCKKEYNFKIDSSVQDRLVIEANLNNLNTPQMIRLTQMEKMLKPVDHSSSGNKKHGIPVDKAKVVLTDGKGKSYTFKRYVEFEGATFNGYYRFEKQIPAHSGDKFTLTVSVKGKVYKAESIVESCPDIIKIKYTLAKSEIPGKEDQYVPLISFTNPDKPAYYLLREVEVNTNSDGTEFISWSNRAWTFSILSSKMLNKNVVDLRVDDGQSPSGSSFYLGGPGSTIRVYMFALNKETYKFYESLIRQFDNDGGAFQPFPSSAPTNFSNNAIGWFNISDGRYADVKIGK